MFEFARVVPHSVNRAVHDQFLLHEYCTYTNPEYIPLPLLHVLMTQILYFIYLLFSLLLLSNPTFD